MSATHNNLVTKDGVVVQVDDVGNDPELKQEVSVGGPTPSNVEVGDTVGQEDEPNEDDDHRTGQTAQRVHWGV